MLKHPIRTLYVFVLLAALVLTACQPSGGGTQAPGAATATSAPAAATSVPSGGQGLSVSKNILLDPALATDADSQSVNNYLYEGLVFDQGDIVPALAASWTVSDDGLSYTFNLRPTASFHSGDPVNADAVIANFNRWFDPADALHGSGAYAAWAEGFLGFKGEVDADGRPKSPYDGIEKVDNLTVLVHLNRVDPEFLGKIAQPAFAIVDPQAVAAGGASYGTASGGAVSGAGPYKVGAWTADKLELAPSPSYWNGAPAAGIAFELK